MSFTYKGHSYTNTDKKNRSTRIRLFLWRALPNKQEATNSVSVSGSIEKAGFLICISDCILICCLCATETETDWGGCGHGNVKVRRQKGNICCKRPLTYATQTKNKKLKERKNVTFLLLISYAVQIFYIDIIFVDFSPDNFCAELKRKSRGNHLEVVVVCFLFIHFNCPQRKKENRID